MMKCPNDQTEMEKGALLNDGNRWVNDFRAAFAGMGIMQGKKVIAYYCPKCGKIELTTEIKDKEEEEKS